MQHPDRTKKPQFKHVKKRNSKEVKNPPPLMSNVGYLSTFILFILTLLIYDLIFKPNFDANVDFQEIKTDLVKNVFKQAEALSAVIESLYKIHNQEQTLSVVNLIGSTGVGKTFAANILKRNFYPSVYEWSGSLCTNAQEHILTRIKASSFKYNLLVFDDLTVDDVDNLLLFIKNLPKDVVIFVVCVFNIQETDGFLNYKINHDHFDIIEDKFNKSKILHEVAKFHEFNADEVEEWIVKQLLMKGVSLQFHSKIIESVLQSQNVKYHGLKGLSSKLNLEL